MRKIILSTLYFLLFLHQLCALESSDDQTEYSYQLSICSVFRDEARFLKEWIEFHLLVGVEHFYLFDNLSTDDPIHVLQSYIDAGIIELFDWPFENTGFANWNQIQCDAFRVGIQKATFKTKWLATIDLDEFIIPMNTNNLVQSLQEFEEFGGVQVNWQCYGTSNVEHIPEDKLMIEMLVMKGPENCIKNQEVKSIIRPDRLLYCDHQHYVIYQPDYYHVNERKERIPEHQWKTNNVLLEKFRINHYWTRDDFFFREIKMKRGHLRGAEEYAIFEKNLLMTEFDPVMSRFVNQMRKRMGLEKKELCVSP